MSKPQFDSLTSLRGIAAWWVVVFHFRDFLLTDGSIAWTISGLGYLAVDLFFIMSGFVIQLNYGNKFSNEIGGGFFDFIVLRLGRIYPLHLFMSILFLVNPLALWLFSSAGDGGSRYDFVQYVCSLFLIHGWGFLGPHGWNVPSWSISVEFAAYLLFPIFAYFIFCRLQGVLACLGVIALSLGLLANIFSAAGLHSIGAGIPELGIVRCCLQFAAGAVLCRFWHCAKAQGKEALYGKIALVFSLLLIVAGVYSGVADYEYMPAALCAFVLSLVCWRGPLDRFLQLGALVWVGEISYSTYLCHYFVKDWVKFILVSNDRANTLAVISYFGLTLLFSMALYRFVETPGRRAVRARFTVDGVRLGVKA